MPLDAVCLTALKNELEGQIIGMRIDKVQQPEKDMLLFSLRGNNSSTRFLIATGTGNARIQLTKEIFENPQSPPMFCMLLRKHLIGARIRSITQAPMERMVDITLDTYDAMGEVSEKHLIAELMGRFCNLILTGSDGIIIDCLRRIDGEMSVFRNVLPGLFYRLPPVQEKRNPLETSADELKMLLERAPSDRPAEKWLSDTFLGFSPLITREIIHRAFGETDTRIAEIQNDAAGRFQKSFYDLTDLILRGDFSPVMLMDTNHKPRDFSYMPIGQYEGAMQVALFDSFSELLENFYAIRDRSDRIRQKSASISKTVKNARDRVLKKLARQGEELKNTQNRERLREMGDLITANLHTMHKGMSVLQAVDFYADQGQLCEIRLDPLKTPQQNVAKYYKDYTKAKNAEKFLTEQMQLAEKELNYLLSVLEEIAKAESEKDLTDIREELILTGYLKSQKTGKKEKRTVSKPMHFRASSGYDIFVGKNNIQNDQLTLKTAFKSDIWLHTQKIHGSHVIISTANGQPDEKTIEEAAILAAYFSQARESSKVPVDYTIVKYVKKPSGAKPGMVIYTDYKTVFVNPDEKTVNQLKVKD